MHAVVWIRARPAPRAPAFAGLSLHAILHHSIQTAHLFAQVTDPEDACEAVQPPGLDKPWIALVVRSRKEHPSCTFDTKVCINKALRLY